MASVHQRPRSPFWHASYLGPDGRWILRSTKVVDRQSALAVAMEFERASKLARRGDLVEAQAREVLKDIMKRADMGETLLAVTIKGHFDTWLTSKQDRKSAGTGQRYGFAVAEFLKSLGSNRASKNLSSLTAADVQRFLDARVAKGLAPMTVSLDVRIIRGALNAARRQGLIPTNPAEAVELPDAKGMERNPFTPAEVTMLVDAAAGEWKFLIMLAYFTGARLGDCCRMQWEGVDMAAETLTYVQSKTGAKVTTPLHHDLMARLNALAGDKPEVFILPHMANLLLGGRHGLSETFKNIMRKAGVDSQTVKGAGNQNFSRRTFHSLRHSFTSALANENVSPELRMKLTGHKTEGEHRKYTHHEMDRTALESAPSGDRLRRDSPATPVENEKAV